MKNKTKLFISILVGVALLAGGGAYWYMNCSKKVVLPETSDQISSLREAISRNNIDAVEFLIKNGVDIEQPFVTSEEQQDNGFTALGWAVFSNRPEIALLLIDNGADVKAAVPIGSSMLFWAITYNMEEVAKKIIDNGGDIYPENGYNPAIHASVQGANRILRMLEAKGVEAKDHHQNEDIRASQEKTLEK